MMCVEPCAQVLYFHGDEASGQLRSNAVTLLYFHGDEVCGQLRSNAARVLHFHGEKVCGRLRKRLKQSDWSGGYVGLDDVDLEWFVLEHVIKSAATLYAASDWPLNFTDFSPWIILFYFIGNYYYFILLETIQ